MPDESEDAAGLTIDQPGIIVPTNLVQLFQQDVHQDRESRMSG